MKNYPFLICFFSIISANLISQNNFFVDPNASGITDGSSWTDAFVDLQTAIETSMPGDSIFLGEGTYVPSKEYEYSQPFDTGIRFRTFAMPDQVAILGGYNPQTGVRDLVAYPSIISGLIDSVACYNTIVYINCTEGTVLDGVIVEKGRADRTGVSQGNGVVIFHDCGAAVQFSSSDVTFKNVWFRNNFANMVGGAIFGGLSSTSRTIKYYNCTFTNNEADGGGAVQISASDQYFYNCVFYDNTAFQGGGIGIAAASTCYVYNSIFNSNNASTQRDIYTGTSSNNLEISHCITQSPGQFGNLDFMIFQDHLFEDALAGDFRLERRSPAINKGTLSQSSLSLDYDLNSRLLDSLDMGIYEFQIMDTDLDMYFDDEDCDITDPNVNPGQTEIPYNGLDDDCFEITLDDDLDQDGFNLNEDCDDNNSNVNPDVSEIPYNDLDDDCNEDTLDDDLDQDGFLVQEDCDDNNQNINPDATEIPGNGIDEDCDGVDGTSSTSQQGLAEFIFYPNPSVDVIHIVTDKQEVQYHIYNAAGVRVEEGSCKSSITIGHLQNGVYSLFLRQQHTSLGSARFIKME